MAKEEITLYSDGATFRYKNRKIVIMEVDGSVMIKFLFADADADKPACYHKCHKGKVRETFIKMNSDAMQRLIYAYIKFKRKTTDQAIEKQ